MSVSKSRKLFELRKQEQKISLSIAWAKSEADRNILVNKLLNIRAKIKSLSV